MKDLSPFSDIIFPSQHKRDLCGSAGHWQGSSSPAEGEGCRRHKSFYINVERTNQLPKENLSFQKHCRELRVQISGQGDLSLWFQLGELSHVKAANLILRLWPDFQASVAGRVWPAPVIQNISACLKWNLIWHFCEIWPSLIMPSINGIM